jgi:NAD(P)-dependent dehydrogenase (short-subunit alcohol dehydrogenase family)
MLKASAFPRLAGRMALITGASRGLGAAIARRFAAEGAHVILLARTVGGLEEVDDAIREIGSEATLIPYDLLKLDDIAGLGPMLFRKFGRLDIFVGNAAMLGHFGPVAHFDTKMWDRVMTLNLTANQRLIQTLDPLLRVGDHGRAIFVTDKAAIAYGGAYAVSKTALEKMAFLYAAETRTTRCRVNLIDPGPMRSALRAQGFPGENPHLHPLPDGLTEDFVTLAEASCDRHGELIEAHRA